MNTSDLDALRVTRHLVAAGRAREIRERSGLTRSEVAATIGVTYGRLTKWELGLRVPTGPEALRYARLLEHLDRQVRA